MKLRHSTPDTNTMLHTTDTPTAPTPDPASPAAGIADDSGLHLRRGTHPEDVAAAMALGRCGRLLGHTIR